MTARLPTAPDPPCAEPRCTWANRRWKHKGSPGLTAEHTHHGPAKYLPELSTEAEMQALERATVAGGARVVAGLRAEYLRDAGIVIGYDLGKEASMSFVECSGGETAGRSFHGRPVSSSNRRVLGGFAQPEGPQQ